VVVLGHSMGSLVALHLAADHPEAVDSLILSAPALQLVSPLAPGGTLQFLTPLVRRLLRRWPIPKSYADPAQLPCDTSYPWAPMDALMSFLSFTTLTRRRLAEVGVPTMILQSRADPVVSPGNVALLQAALATPPSQQRVVWFERSRHELFRDCDGPAAVGTVVGFVQERLRLAATAEPAAEPAAGPGRCPP
jgi:carboxylesterase